MHRLTNVEAQRIMAVISESLERLELLSYVAALPDGDPAALRAMVGEDVAGAIEEQHRLEAKYEALVGRGDAAGRAQKAKQDANSSEIKDALKHLRQSTRGLCRVLREHREVVEQLKENGAKPTPPAQVLISNLKELREITYQKLLTTVEEEKSKQDFLSEIGLREKRATNELKNLQKELAEEQREREREISARNAQISRLKEELSNIKSTSTQQNKNLDRESRAKEANDDKVFQEREQQLQGDIRKLEDMLDDRTQKHRESELLLRKKTHKSEQEVDNWISKYDQEMHEKERELEKLKAIYSEEKAQLEDLEKRYQLVSSDWETLLAERNKLLEERQNQESRQRRLHESATLIQAAWRGFRERKRMETKRRRRKTRKSGSPRRSRGSPNRSRPTTTKSTKSFKSQKSALSARS